MNTVNDAVFDELMREATKIWLTYDNSYGYVDEKLARLESLTNFHDNFGTIIGMFDNNNQRKLYEAVSPDAQMAIDIWTGGKIHYPERSDL